MPGIKLIVNTYSGYEADERPVSFTIAGKTLNVEEILDMWRGEDDEYFKLRADDDCTYIIRYDRDTDEWELTMMERCD